MKIAVPTRGTRVDDHFGHCEVYTIYTVEDNKVTKKETMDSPQGCGCKSDIAYTLRDEGVSMMLAGNMGQGAFNKLTGAGLQVVRGCSGDIDALMNDYLGGQVEDNQILCAQHEHHHGHDHDHHHHDHGHQCHHS